MISPRYHKIIMLMISIDLSQNIHLFSCATNAWRTINDITEEILLILKSRHTETEKTYIPTFLQEHA